MQCVQLLAPGTLSSGLSGLQLRTAGEAALPARRFQSFWCTAVQSGDGGGTDTQDTG